MGRYVPLGRLNSQLAIKIGTDIVFMKRYVELVNNDTFIEKILTSNEMEILSTITHPQKRLEFVCGRYAAKEAYSKACGTGIGEVTFHDVEILRNSLGAPTCDKAEVSISHDGDYAIAMVLVYE